MVAIFLGIGNVDSVYEARGSVLGAWSLSRSMEHGGVPFESAKLGWFREEHGVCDITKKD